ncbi:TrmJ/YjtD family RNA methyltransferase [Halobaculum sp. MBLA0147]|uniref:RNA methyltransferase n=1 Tax=Halobaculum sp. MBLA0147 TaxID=3079934 RepID=UPI0035234DA5
MSEYAVVVVEPETPGNVGTIARSMKNFGLYDLKLVDPPEIGEGTEAYGFAGHAREDVLPNADTVTLDEVIESYHTVGFTGITAEDATSHTRFPYTTPAELRDDLATVDTDTALVFGRESRGLNNDELDRLDEVASIPANPEYPVLNLGQAATVTLYELRELFLDETHLPDRERERADEAEIERLHEQFGRYLDAVEHREHVRERAGTLLRRVVGRAHPTDREVTTLTGLFRKTADRWNVVDEPDDTAGSDEPDDTAGSDEPDDTAGSDEPDDTAGSDEPDDTAASDEPDDTTGSDEPDDTGEA